MTGKHSAKSSDSSLPESLRALGRGTSDLAVCGRSDRRNGKTVAVLAAPTPSRPRRVDLLKHCQELLARANLRQTIDDGLCPIKVLAPPLKAPVRGRSRSNVAQVTDLVGELHERAPPAHVPGMLNLQPLALHLRQ